MKPYSFLVGSLACYRATVMVARDCGPWNVFGRLRKVARFSKLLGCPYCVSVWLGFLFTLLLSNRKKDSLAENVACALALSGVAVILDRTFSSDHICK